MHVAGMKQEGSRRSPPDATITCGRSYLVSDVVFTLTTSRRIGDITRKRRGDKAMKLFQQGLHLTMHSCGGSLVLVFSHRLQQLIKASVGVMKVQVAEDVSQCS